MKEKEEDEENKFKISKTEATLSPVNRRGTRANRQRIKLQRPLLSPVDSRDERANSDMILPHNLILNVNSGSQP